jgi:hypothetical protein
MNFCVFDGVRIIWTDRHSDCQLRSDLDFGLTESYETLKYTVFVPYARLSKVKSRRYVYLTLGLDR